MEVLVDKLMSSGFEIGKNVVIALVIFVVGRYLISLVNKLVRAMMERRQLDPAIRSFLGSMINIVLMVLLIISVVGALGVQYRARYQKIHGEWRDNGANNLRSLRSRRLWHHH